MFHDGFWTIQFVAVVALFIGGMWIPNDPVLIGYMKFSRYVSSIFLAYQGMIMLIVAYLINSSLVAAVDREGKGAGSCAGITLITMFLLLTIGNISFIVCQFVYLANPGCSGNITIMSITTAVGVLVFNILVCLRTRNDASVFTSALVLTYCLYLQWSAISGQNSQECNPFYPGSTDTNTTANTSMMMFLGFMFTFISLFVISAVSMPTKEQQETPATEMNQALIEDNEENQSEVADVEDHSGNKVTAKDMHVYPISNATVFF